MQVMGGTAQFPPAHSPLPTPGKGGTQELRIYERLLKAGHSYYPELSRDMNKNSREMSDRKGV